MRTGLAAEELTSLLVKMCETGTARKGEEQGRYFPTESHIVSQALGEIHKAYFIAFAQEMLSRAELSFAVSGGTHAHG
jgi:hypothetical protein